MYKYSRNKVLVVDTLSQKILWQDRINFNRSFYGVEDDNNRVSTDQEMMNDWQKKVIRREYI